MAGLGHPHRPAEDDVLGVGERLGGRLQFVGRDAGQLLDFLGGERLNFPFDLREPFRIPFDKLLVVQVVLDEISDESVEPRHVVAGRRSRVLVGVLGDADFPGVEHHEVGPVADVLLDASRQHRMRLGRVRPADEVGVGLADVLVDAVRHRAVAERLLERRHRRRVTEPGAVVDVLRAEHLPRELLDEIRLLVAPLRRREATDRVDAVFVLNLAESAGDVVERLVPRGRLELAVFVSNQGLREPLLAVGKVVAELPFHARREVVRRGVVRVVDGLDADGVPVFAPHLEPTADRAEPAGRLRFVEVAQPVVADERRDIEQSALRQRPRREVLGGVFAREHGLPAVCFEEIGRSALALGHVSGDAAPFLPPRPSRLGFAPSGPRTAGVRRAVRCRRVVEGLDILVFDDSPDGVPLREPRKRERPRATDVFLGQGTGRTDRGTVSAGDAVGIRHRLGVGLEADAGVLPGALDTEDAFDLHVVTALDAPVTEDTLVAVDLDERGAVVERFVLASVVEDAVARVVDPLADGRLLEFTPTVPVTGRTTQIVVGEDEVEVDAPGFLGGGRVGLDRQPVGGRERTGGDDPVFVGLDHAGSTLAPRADFVARVAPAVVVAERRHVGVLVEAVGTGVHTHDLVVDGLHGVDDGRPRRDGDLCAVDAECRRVLAVGSDGRVVRGPGLELRRDRRLVLRVVYLRNAREWVVSAHSLSEQVPLGQRPSACASKLDSNSSIAVSTGRGA